MSLHDLKDKWGQLVADARKIFDDAKAASREPNKEEDARFDQIMADADKVEEQIRRLEKLEAKEKLASETHKPDRPDVPGSAAGAEKEIVAKKLVAFEKALRYGKDGLSHEELQLVAGSDPTGGYLVPPPEFVRNLLIDIDNQVEIRRRATVLPALTASNSLGVPSVDTDVNDAEWTAEVLTGSEDTALRFGLREMKPNPLAKRIKISNKLLLGAAFDVEAFIRTRFAYKFAVTMEKAYISGDGASKPLGLFVPSDKGISTSRDVTCGSAAAAPVSADGLIDMKFTLKPAYWPKAAWLLHRDIVKGVRKLKDSQNNYLWLPGIQQGLPDRILDLPYIMSEYAPTAVTQNAYPIMVGDFSYYWIVDALALQFQRLAELYAEQNQIGYISRLETDGMPVMEAAFVRGKVAA